MSVENVKAFLEKLNSDETFLNQIAGASSDEARLELAKANGFNFTVEELAVVADDDGSEELTEEELESVAGGWSTSGDADDRPTEEFSGLFKKLSKKYTEVEWTY